MRKLLVSLAVVLACATPAAADELLVAIKKGPVFSNETGKTIAQIEVGQVVTSYYCNSTKCKISKPIAGSVLRARFEPFTGVVDLPCVQLNGKRC